MFLFATFKVIAMFKELTRVDQLDDRTRLGETICSLSYLIIVTDATDGVNVNFFWPV